MTGSPDNGHHGIGDDEVAKAFAEAFGWPSDDERAPEPERSGDPVRDAFVSAATRAAGEGPSTEPAAGSDEADRQSTATRGPSMWDAAAGAASEPEPPSGPRTLEEALALCERAPGYVAATIVNSAEQTPLAHHSRFEALTGEAVSRMVGAWTAGMTAAIGHVGGEELFGSPDTGLITTEAAAVHIGIIDDSHALVIVTDVPPDETGLAAARVVLVDSAVAIDALFR